MSSETEEKAREEADARRQRILDRANARLDQVSGITEGGGDGSSKLAAMRRRRFKKSSKDETKEETSNVTNDEKVVTEEETIPETEEVTAPQGDAAAPEPLVDSADSGATKKKYVGVAKMRRKMILEKKEKEGSESSPVESVSSAPLKVRKQRVATVPILMHAVTVLLLFLAGFEVGLQQGDFASDTLVKIHTDFAPRQLGLKLIPIPSKVERKLEEEPETVEWKPSEDDEFADNTEAQETVENIDPLFQVDLDKYTRGPGLLMWLGRGAVALHRVNLSIFYYFPRRIVMGIVKTLVHMVERPPILCLLALVIRQLIGKTVLGAKLPGKLEDETQQKDIMSVVKQFVSGFILKSFPTAVSLYDAWTHLRADMYVVMCGLVVGLALTYGSALKQTGIPVPVSIPDRFQGVQTNLVPLPDNVRDSEGIPVSDVIEDMVPAPLPGKFEDSETAESKKAPSFTADEL